MRSQEEIDLENMALAAELGRQLCHEFSNFLYMLFLQADIVQAGASPPREGWAAVKRDGQEIVRFLEEWGRFHRRFCYAETALDLHQVICQMATEAAAADCMVQLAPTIQAGPLPILGTPIDTRHLLRLVVEGLFQQCEAAGCVPAVSIQTEAVDSKVIVRIVATRDPGEDLPDDEAAESSLIAKACRSLAVRLGAGIQREVANHASVVRIEFQPG